MQNKLFIGDKYNSICKGVTIKKYQSFIKWIGGKRGLLKDKKIYLSDVNAELVNAYNVVKIIHMN